MYYHHGYYDDASWAHPVLGGLLMLLFWVALVLATVLIVRGLTGKGDRRPPMPPPPRRSDLTAREALDLRFANGEIDDSEYKRIRVLLDAERLEG